VLVDLHAHYPMHLLAPRPEDVTLERMVRGMPRSGVRDKLRAWLLGFLARILNYRRFSDTWRVELASLEAGDVRVVLSVLYQPFDEMDLEQPYGSDPEPGYFPNLVGLLDKVEAELRQLDPGATRHAIVKTEQDLDNAQNAGHVAFLHCVEGGFHLGNTPEEIARNVGVLAGRGVVYITLAHLFWRKIATNAPALPFLADPVYNAVFPQPREGLTELGIAAVRAMYEHRVLVDVSHMRGDALEETFALLDSLDREHGAEATAFPVIASHSGSRFGGQEYNLTADAVRRIAARGGVVGLILAQHQLNDGIRRKDTTTLDESLEVIHRHIGAIRDATGNLDHVAIGSDFDGFIKPTMGGLESAADLAKLRAPLTDRYGADAEKILTGNALRVLRSVLA
jgi:microsomal dipeptidase-like Zn-dependent dipeptidase